MKKLLLSIALLCLSSFPLNAAIIRVICCDESTHDFYGIGEEAYSKILTKPESYEMYLRSAAEVYCEGKCIKQVFELKGSAFSLSVQTIENGKAESEQDELLIAAIKNDVKSHPFSHASNKPKNVD